MDDLPLIEDNNQNDQINNQNNEEGNNEINKFDYLTIYLNIVPSTIYTMIIGLILFIPLTKQKEDFLSQSEHIILYLKLILIIYLLYIVKGLYHFMMTKRKLININAKVIIAELLHIILDISYYIFTIAGYNSFKKLSLGFIIDNIFTSIFIYSLIFIGYIYMALFFVNILLVSLCFLYNVWEFLRDEVAFISNHPGSSRFFESFLKREKADEAHIDVCSICTDNIILGDNIIILACSDKHFFHEDCIIQWLRYNFVCPICRSIQII